MEERVKSLEEETKSIHGGLVGLQFQAEKEEAVKTLASRMDRIDAERQQSEARATEQQQRLVEENSERLEELQRRVAQLESMERKVNHMEGKILEVGQQSMGDWEAMEAQLKVLQREAEEQGRQMAAVEPRAAELEQKVEEMQSKIQEKITLLVSRSEEHSNLIERSSTSIAMFSEKITSYEKEVKEVANSGTHDLDSFKQEVERKILELFDTTEDQADQIESQRPIQPSPQGQGNAELVERVNGQADAVESVESELETAKDRLRKNVEAVEGINKSIMVFESRHVETVERMKEVIVIASSVETYVKSQEQSREQDTARHMDTYSNQLEELRSEVAGALGRLGRVDEDNQTLLEKINNSAAAWLPWTPKTVSWRCGLVRQLQNLWEGCPSSTTREDLSGRRFNSSKMPTLFRLKR